MHIEQTIKTDLLVVGGGINGTGVAVDASLRGLSVVLAEANDLACGTSSASSKLIHGGLRYLEQYDFKLVRASLQEREILLNKAPHIIHPLRFVLPHNKKLRPVWQMRIGLFLYDLLAGRTQLAPSKKISLHGDYQKGLGLKDQFTIGFEYSDCRIDDARMVVFNAKQAESHGAKILLPFACVKLQREKNWWCAKLASKDSQLITVYAKAVVNAAGPWVQQFMQQALGINKPSSMRSVKGSHPMPTPGEPTSGSQQDISMSMQPKMQQKIAPQKQMPSSMDMASFSKSLQQISHSQVQRDPDFKRRIQQEYNMLVNLMDPQEAIKSLAQDHEEIALTEDEVSDIVGVQPLSRDFPQRPDHGFSQTLSKNIDVDDEEIFRHIMETYNYMIEENDDMLQMGQEGLVFNSIYGKFSQSAKPNSAAKLKNSAGLTH